MPWACLAAVVVLLSATAWTLFRRSQREVRAAAPSPDVPVAVAAPAAPVAPVQSVPEPIPAPLVPVQSIPGAFGGRVTGNVMFTASDRVCVATLGGNTVRDLGPGTFARWGPDGRAIAVVHDGGVEVMGTDGSERRRLVRAGVNEPACPIEFHPNGREILFCVDGGGLRSVEIATGRVRDWKIPFEREIGISQDGRRLAGRHRKDLCSAEMPFERLRKYADGCSSGISPDGLWLLANRGDHKSISLTPFEGGSPRILRAQGLEPDPKWDNQTWSNHPDYLVAQGYGGPGDCYVLELSTGALERVTFDQGAHSPDLWVEHAVGSAPKEAAVASARAADLPGQAAIPWPVAVDRTIFFWENSRGTNQLPGVDGGAPRLCRVTPVGPARFGRHYEMEITGAAFRSEGWTGGDGTAPVDLDAVTLEMLVTSEGDSGVLVSVGRSAGDIDMAVEERNGRVRLRAGAHCSSGIPEQGLELCALPARQPSHLVLTLGRAGVACHLDGRRVLIQMAARAEPAHWRGAAPRFGAYPLEKGSGWRGSIGRVAFYRGTLSAEEIERAAEGARLAAAARVPAREWVVEAELLQQTPHPKPSALQDYARGLVWHEYEVRKMVRGQLETNRFKAAHWAVLDRETVYATANLERNRIYRLNLQAYADNPQLESEWNDDRLGRFDLPEFYVPGAPVALD